VVQLTRRSGNKNTCLFFWQICRPRYLDGNTELEYTFPLGKYVLDDAMDSDKKLFMKFVLRLRTKTDARMLKYISTKTAIRRSCIQEKCPAPLRIDSSLGEILKFDMLDGLFSTEDRFNQTETSLFEDITSNAAAASTIKVNIGTPLTFMLRIDEGVLAKSGLNTYGIDVVSIFTM